MHSTRFEIHPALVAVIGIAATALALLTTGQEGIALLHAGRDVPWLGLFKARLVDWYACALFVPLLLWLVRRYPVDRPHWRNHLPILLLAAVPVAVAKEAVFVSVGEFFRPGVFDLATILSEDLSYEVMAVWALLAACHLLVPPEKEIRQRQQASAEHEIRVPTRNGVERVAIAEIEYVDAHGNYARLVTPRGRFLVRETMGRLETRLGAAFVRVHRSIIVRRDRIERVEAAANGGYWIQLASGARLRCGRSYRAAILAAGLLSVLFLALPILAEAPPVAPVVQEWKVEWGGRPRDPFVGPDGKVWFVGQAGNYVAHFDPATERFRRYEIEADTHPHSLIVDPDGFVWYAGNMNARIGKLDPKSGDVKIFPTGEARDPHTMVFDGRGHIWFTSQQANRVGRLDMKTGAVRLVTPHEDPAARPYGIVLDAKGDPWVSLLGTNQVVRIDAGTFALSHLTEATPDSRSRRIEVTADGAVWYGDEPRGFLGRIDPLTRKVVEFALPGGADSKPYALTEDGDGRLWVSQSGPDKKLVAFDPERRQFVATHGVSATIRHMMFDEKTGAMWFGTDDDRIGRVLTRPANSR